jgi:hypothetical protein
MRARVFTIAAFSLAMAFSGLNGWAADTAAPGGQVKYISGGVGEDSDARMQALSKDYNLKLLFAAKDGHYLADVAVTITDARGAKVLDAVSDGPWLLANLAPGKYEITAAYDGKPVTRSTTIAASGRREVFFRWEETPE